MQRIIFHIDMDAFFCKALDLFREKKPNLVLLDILMPEMDGVKAFHEIRKINPKY